MCFLVLIYSCTSNLVKERANSEVTDVYVDVDDVIDELDFSLFLNDEAKFIKLETTDSCLISEMKQISYVDGKIYIADELSQSVYIFNDSGSFLKKIGVKGQGPGEYVRLGKFQVVGNYLYIKDDASPWKLYVYDLKSSVGRLMDIDENGTVVAHRIAETVIRVDRRMSYNQVRCILEDGDTETSREYKEFVPMFFLMKELSALLRSKRHNRGSIDFDFPESKIILNGAGRAIDVKPYEQNVATQIIEDFMLMANETVAKEYCQGEYPFVYRTHDNPDPERVESLLTLLRHQGIQVQKACEEITPKEIQEILEQIPGMPNEMMISRLMLRTMKQARYTTECSGHFGLAAKYYCHFTSPIRRYPDLQIHRIIRDNIRGRLQREGKTEHYREILEHVAEQSSVCERRAQEAERESDRLKKAEYMSYHLGEIFDGIISGVTAYGFYVELPNTVEGLVHITALSDDYYEFDEENYELRGELTKKVYHLGQKVTVRVADADALKRTVDFSVVENTVDEMGLNE